MKRYAVLVASMSLFLIGAASTKPLEEGKPDEKKVEDIPSDVARLSTTWTELPKTVRDTGKKEGAVQGVTKGPVKGTGKVVKKTVQEVWSTVQEEEGEEPSRKQAVERPPVLFDGEEESGHRGDGSSKDPVFKYEF